MRKHLKFGSTSFATAALFTLGLLLPVFAIGQTETIDATARGTSTQMGAVHNIKIVISDFSISNYHTPFGEIINLIVSLNPLKEVESINLERLKAGWPLAGSR